MSLSDYVAGQNGINLNIARSLHYKGTADSYFKRKGDTLHLFPLYTLLSTHDFYEIFKE